MQAVKRLEHSLAEVRVCCRCQGTKSLPLAGKVSNDLRDQQQQAAGDQRQLPGNQEKQYAKNQRHTDVDDHAGEHRAGGDDAPSLGDQGVEHFSGIVGVQVALAHAEQLTNNTAAEAVTNGSVD